ncbi:hypothetical protein [Pelagibius sp. 7325]|uniref:hypothetical protein n=1 Tax=Pelagibius sp. 7325 TaxID=3131994 RepID=UPI0030EE0463
MDEALLWIVRAAVVVVVIAIAAAIVRFLQAEEEVDRNRYDDRDTPYLKQKKTIGNAFGSGSSVPRWLAWLGAASPFLLFGLVWLLTC